MNEFHIEIPDHEEYNTVLNQAVGSAALPQPLYQLIQEADRTSGKFLTELQELFNEALLWMRIIQSHINLRRQVCMQHFGQEEYESALGWVNPIINLSSWYHRISPSMIQVLIQIQTSEQSRESFERSERPPSNFDVWIYPYISEAFRQIIRATLATGLPEEELREEYTILIQRIEDNRQQLFVQHTRVERLVRTRRYPEAMESLAAEGLLAALVQQLTSAVRLILTELARRKQN
jgi:hypothetical protein